MKITILTEYYLPETGAPQNRLSDLARRMTEAGHEVTVLTAKPNYPVGRIHDDFRGGFWKTRREGNVRVVHCWLYATRSKRTALRLANYFSFVISSALVGTLLLRRSDFLIVESPPIFLGLTAWYLSRLKRAKMIFNVSDLYPQTAVELGYLRPGLAAKVLFRLEAFCYAASALVTGQTRGIIRDIQQRFPAQPLFLLTNGIDVADFAGGVRREMSEIFTVGYAGVHGHAQGLHAVLDAAERLQARNAPVRLEFFGDGPLREDLQTRARQLNLTNVEFFGHRSRADILQHMKRWDAGIVPLVNAPLMAGALPSKLFEMMAAALPVVLAAPRGEASELLESAGAGITAKAEDGESIADALSRLAADREASRAMGARARAYVLEHYDRGRIATAFMSRLAGLARP